MLTRSSRSTRSWLPALIACVGGFATTASWGETGAPCSYSVTEAGAAWVCGGFQLNKALNPRGLNNLGHWAGYRFQCLPNDDMTMAIRWTPEGGVQALPVPADTSKSSAAAINDQGTVVGIRSGVTNGQSHGDWACIWQTDGTIVEIPPLGGCPALSAATAINAIDAVVGWRGVACGVQFGFVWQSGALVDIDPLPSGFSAATPFDISDSGFVVGLLGSDAVPGGRAFRWKDGSITVLEPLHGGSVSIAFEVNSSGYVAGLSRQNPTGAGGAVWPTLWMPDGSAVELPVLAGYANGSCRKINDDGLVAGQASTPLLPGLAAVSQVIWVNGQPIDVKTLIDHPNGASFGAIQAINSFGDLLGTGAVGGQSGGAWILAPIHARADLSGDCIVDGIDLSLLLEAWGPVVRVDADLNHDGLVDGQDLGTLLGEWTND